MLPDCHMHTSFSGDCDVTPEIMIEAAIEKKIKTITITDHLDIDYPNEPDLFLLDLDDYTKTVNTLKEKYRSDIELLYGIELGLQPHLSAEHKRITSNYNFDFVIGSSHVAHKVDPYYPEFFTGRTSTDAFREYFESIVENINAFDGFDSYGHLDYVVRYAPDKSLSYDCYELFPELVDKVLILLIEKDKAIEINSGSYKAGLNTPNPTASILRRYMELGGKYITCGADAHKPEFIGSNFDKLSLILSEIGANNITVFKSRKPVMLPLNA